LTMVKDNQYSDQELQTKVAISLRKLQQAADLKVTVKAGIVYLDGQVAKPADEELARHLVARIPGVKEVISRLKPAIIRHVDDQTVTSEVEKALASTRDFVDANIIIHCEQGTVYLNGWVETQEMRIKVAQVAAQVAGVVKVVNNLLVEEEQTETDAYLTNILRQALSQSADIPSGQIQVFILRGWAYLTGEVDTVEQKEAPEEIISYINENLESLEGLKNDIRIRLH
jgi:osmotically-inducible protein OsmY